MSSNLLSVAETLTHLEKKIALHKEQHELHERQEAFHAEQKVLHETELRKAVESFEAFKAASAGVGEILVDVKPSAPSFVLPAVDVEPGDWRWLSRLMRHVVESKAPDETFGASTILKEVKARWGSKLRHRVDPRSVSATLRRWAASGRIHLVRDGRSYSESLYTRRRQPPEEGPA